MSSTSSPKKKDESKEVSTNIEVQETKQDESPKATLQVPSATKPTKDFDFHLLEPIGKGKISILYRGVNLQNGESISIKYSISI